MAQVTGRSREPSKEHVYRDDEGDYWYFSDQFGWQYAVREDVARDRRENDRGGEKSSHFREWAYVQRQFKASFPMDKLAEPTITGPAEMPHPGEAGFQVLEPPTNGEQGFVVKDSGVREEYANGFVRDTEEGKPDLTEPLRLLYARPDLAALISRPGFDLLPVEGLERWADHMDKGAQKYGRDNWRQARGLVAKTRFLRSLVRHVAQYITGDRTEDHAAAICFNVWAAEVTPAEELET